MRTPKVGILLFTILCIAATALVLQGLGALKLDQLHHWLMSLGIWAPITYIVLYVIATLLMLPSTALNLTGGALFGPWFGTLWTSLAAITAAIVAFLFTRTVGRESFSRRLEGRWQSMDREIRQGGLFYMFAVRLIPIMPYGLVNFAAGVTSIRFKDFVLGTILGTVPSILPFVMLGSSGLKAVTTGDILPLVGAFALTGVLVGGATWYRHRSSK